MRRLMVIAATLAVLGAACQKDESPTISTKGSPSPSAEASVSISSPADGAEVNGNVVPLAVAAKSIEIKAADGDKSGKSGHYHVFVDKDPGASGEVIPKEPGIIHAATSPVTVAGLKPGEHTLTVVLGNGAHERIGDATAGIKVNVKGPSVTASAPATAKVGESVTLDLASEGVDIKAADGDNSGKTGHYHVFVDPEKPPAADGQVIPKVENKIIHTTEPKVELTGLAAGEHTIWVVVGDGRHIPLDPLTAAKLTVVVS
jgi:hypothetical protein